MFETTTIQLLRPFIPVFWIWSSRSPNTLDVIQEHKGKSHKAEDVPKGITRRGFYAATPDPNAQIELYSAARGGAIFAADRP